MVELNSISVSAFDLKFASLDNNMAVKNVYL